MLRSALVAVQSKLTFPFLWLLTVCAASLGLWLFSPQPAEAVVYEGFGAAGWSPSCDGGAGQPPIFTVTNLNDSGAGSLRDAVSQGNRTIKFDSHLTDLGDHTNTITLTSGEIKVKGSFILICGLSAPSPGITLRNYGLYLSGTKNVHHVLIQGLRIRNAAADAITVRDNAHHVIIDHVSTQGSHDGDIDVTRGASDVTVQWSIVAENDPTHNLLALLDFQSLRTSVNHTLFVKGQSRQPHTGWDGTLATTPPPATPDIPFGTAGTVADVVNNVIWRFSAYGTLVFNNANTNVEKNFYHSVTQSDPSRALRVNSGGKAYAQGNISPTIANIDGQGTPGQARFPAAPVTTTDPCTAAVQILAEAGARTPNLDSIDQQYITDINNDITILTGGLGLLIYCP